MLLALLAVFCRDKFWKYATDSTFFFAAKVAKTVKMSMAATIRNVKQANLLGYRNNKVEQCLKSFNGSKYLVINTIY